MIRRRIIPRIKVIKPQFQTHNAINNAINHQIRLKATTSENKPEEEPRINPVGIQHLSKGIYNQLFPEKSINSRPSDSDKKLIELSQDYLKHHSLLGKKTAISKPIDFDLPELQGNNLDEHFKRIALYSSQDYLENAKHFAQIGSTPKPPTNWVFKSGWTKYPTDGTKPHSVDFPDEKALIFDVETLYKVSNFAIMATAVSENAWYGWISPVLTGESQEFDHLIPFDTLNKPRLLIGHNVGYDRARIKEEYNLKETKAFFLDTMSLHIAASGMCSRQRPTWMYHNKQRNESGEFAEDIRKFEIADPWVDESAPNSLAAVAKFYCDMTLDKDVRDSFAGDDITLIRENFQNLMNYCANDVATTYKIYTQVLPEFLKVCPHPVSFAALRFMGAGILTTNKDWEKYLKAAETLYQEAKAKVHQHLVSLVNKALKLKDKPKVIEKDPWLSQLDWTIYEQKFRKDGQPYKNQKLAGYPEWYRDMYIPSTGKLNLSTRSRITPILFKLTWEGFPVVWSDVYGWCFRADVDKYDEMIAKTYLFIKNFTVKKRTEEEEEEMKFNNNVNDIDIFGSLNINEKRESPKKDKPAPTDQYAYFKIPNNAGPEARTALLLAKSFASSFEKGILSSESAFAKEALDINASCSYWISSRERIMNQFVYHKTKGYSIILPQLLTMGTITRRAVEKTWLTASNAKKTRIGSELKSKIKAPKGYCIVGADVDSEELWIASLVGDSMFKLHGGTAIGWMTLEGTKNEGTDLHSKTASILGISRNEAKIFNYGRIYGAGLKFATRLLKQFNPKLTDKECEVRAKNLYNSTKGQSLKIYKNDDKGTRIWVGGTESILFNQLESIAEQDNPKTPVLGAGITKALMKKNLKKNSFLPSRVNWAIQSSGVDYLHLLCVSMNYLINKYKINARLSLSVHDEIRYLVKEKDKYRAAMALQISNLWTRGIFCERLGISDVPQSCAFFSAVDIDHVLRKEVDMDCITPSNKIPIPPGESLDINQLLDKPESELGEAKDLKLEKIELVKNVDMLKHKKKMKTWNDIDDFSLENPVWKETYLRLQIAQSEEEFKKIWSGYRRYLREVKQGSRNEYDFMEPSFKAPINPKPKQKKISKQKISANAIDAFFQNSNEAEKKKKPTNDRYTSPNASVSKPSKTYDYDYDYFDFGSPPTDIKTKPNNIRPKPKPSIDPYYYNYDFPDYGQYN
ncbi:DNA polymerase gamma 1 [Wickerhamomyces ciferrii]|uniref:DNA polymerase gamma n=1 Tax=Wickerhamomyces ciferrii (strain ATCC 14091 / BCRC 22168 / CBS 111 / JCM 3599 / NBRC 0793 / NRRL Y-1031 F-60-10) TaxID=1206466 RepID=K0KV39_WICCF|nr:DNA polymerase gamma 1 [Wickerhamomyces ciferrii]CCH45279.1 DNA polymerase gamma 1 [Wickerhamomyces ciferrii]